MKAWMTALGGGVSLAALGFPALAQTVGNPPVAASAGIEDIIVTARREQESLQTTPVAVTAVGAEFMKQSQVGDIADLQRSAPSLTIATGAPSASGFAFVAIRGQGSLSAGVAVDPAVAMYIDGVYIARPSQALVDLQDIARVEVLRGPQGTLFGRNTTGGAVNIISEDPVGHVEGSVRVELGNYDYRSAGATLNLPIQGDDLALRMTYNYRERGGYGQNIAIDRDANDLKSHFLRGKLRWNPAGGPWSVTLAGDYSHQKDAGQLVALGGLNMTTSAIPAALRTAMAGYLHTKDNWYDTAGTGYADASQKPFNATEAYGGSVTVDGEVGSAKLKAITAYRYSNATGFIDLDATPIPILATESGYLSRAWSQEFQLSGDLGSRLDWIAGAYYSRETGVEYSVSQTFGFAGGPSSVNDADVKNVTAGIFAQANYQIADGLHATAGLRWTWDKRQVVLHNLRNAAAGPDATLPSGLPNCAVSVDSAGGPCNQTQVARFDYPAWTLGVDYQVAPELFVYGKTSRASKSGGWNLRLGSIPAFAPETVRDVEVGLKSGLFDNRVRFNVALFHTWLKNTQRVAAAFVGGTQTTYLVNAGNAKIYGAEFELTARPWTGMEVRGNLALLHGAYDKGTFTENQMAGGVPVVVDRSDEPFLQIPKRQVSIGATQSLGTAAGELSLHADYSYISSQYFFTSTLAAGASPAAISQTAIGNRLGRIPGYGLLNARVGLAIEGTGLEAAVFARNLAGKKYLTRSFANLYATPIGVSTDYVGDPMTWGGSLTYRF